MISSALPSLKAIATPEALVKAWARWAITASSSGEAPRVLLLAVLFAVSEAWVAMVRSPLIFNFVFSSTRVFDGFGAKQAWAKNQLQRSKAFKNPDAEKGLVKFQKNTGPAKKS
jgi:hypothetical protein